ncbi:MAG TPA: hypothetical protein P5079_10595, partial [Elusimicrobiota bacterium]|nr:hypothetical protein [Elusimicrobiota bacterium]
ALRPTVDEFFKGVMVMDPNEEVRLNRLNLLIRLTALFRRLADLSRLQDVPSAQAVSQKS